MTRFRRQMVATGAALGIAAAVAGTAAAADQVNYVNVPSDFSQPLGITAGPDGNMWFADPGAQSIGKMPPGGNPLLIPAPGAGGPAGITSGPGGLWYSEFGSDPTPGAPGDETARVSRMTTGGSVAATTLTGALNLQGIAVGPDGNLWVAAKGTDQLWQVGVAGGAPSGANTAFAAANAQSVASGPAGDPNIYVTTSGGVFRTSTTAPGAPGLFSSLTNAFGIALGPDGNWWVTHPGGIEHIATNGAPLPGGVAVPGSDSRGVAVGPDGAMWFAQYATDTVGVVTTSGQYRAIPVPNCDGPEGVAAGPPGDAAVYVTCFGSNAPLVRGRTIVRITQSGGVTPAPVGPVAAPIARPGAPIAGLTASFSLKKKVVAGKRFTVSVKFNKAVTKSQVRVQIRNSNTKLKGAIKKFKTIRSKLVTGTKAGIPVKIAKPGVYLLRVTYRNGPRTVNMKAVKLTVKPKTKRR